jgi:hypothetical protein
MRSLPAFSSAHAQPDMRVRASQRTLGAKKVTLKPNNSGSSIIELTLLVPWILFLMAGIVDLGFFTYSLIAVENAARVAATYTSKSHAAASHQAGACDRVLLEMARVPNLGGVSSTCNAAPLIVTAERIPAGPDGEEATSVTVTYQGAALIPIPGLLLGRLNVTRNVQMRVRP